VLTVAIVAGEASGDALGAALIDAIRARRPDAQFFGVAGPAMIASGCEALESAESLAVMGLFEVVAHLPRVLGLRRRVMAEFLGRRPDVFIGVDAPEFNLSLAPALRAAGIRTVQYVSPQVWAWRQGRVRRMARVLDLVLCLLPFEPRFYAAHGLAATFVGHPLADRIPLVPERDAARAALGLPGGVPVLAVLPGSRAGEVARLGPAFARTLRRLASERPALRFVAPMARPALAREFGAMLERHAPGVAVQLQDGRAREALVAADAALIASGTATLEAMLCKRPMVVAYRVGAATAAVLRVFRLLKSPFIAQPNLLAGRRVVAEFVQGQVEPETLAAAVAHALDDGDARASLQARFTELHATLRRGASERAADAVLALLERRPPA
jgi:lipid-A-disaccharide synthase